MKIVSVTMVKNESDIIESFIRYQLNIVDEMIILDNFSNDSTPDIINNLIDEGLPVILINDTDDSYAQSPKMTKLLNIAVKEYGADIVCLIDCDEFIISDNGENPRLTLENLDSSKYHLIKWVTYIPTPQDDYNIKFIPKRINHIRDESLETYYKVIVPKEIVNNYNVTVEMGNHDLIIKNGNKEKLANYDLNLKMAHIPLRSKEQCMSKIMVGWPNIIATNTENEFWAYHWKELFDKIKDNNDISLEDLEDFSKNYSMENKVEEVSTKKQPINLDFCEDIEIKYVHEYNYLNNILDNEISLANDVVSLKRELNVLKGKTSLIKSFKMKIYEKYIK